MAMKKQEFDIVVIGANGYVGKRLVAELERLSATTGWKVLATTRAPKKSLSSGYPSIVFDLLDVTDAQAVDRVVARASLVLNCVGPFDLYGEKVVSACARLGRHYLDITGEILFARRMIDAYDSVAIKTGAMIVPFAGFDSVPSDFGVYLMAKEMNEVHHQKIESIDLVYDVKGGFNGGTAATMLDIGAKLSLADMRNLGFLSESVSKPRFSLRSREMYGARYVPQLKKWTAPFFMEPINNKIIYRSISLDSDLKSRFSENFKYRESMSVPGGFFGSVASGAFMGGTHLLLKTSLGRDLISRIVPKPGMGPSEKQMTEGFFRATFVARGVAGESKSKILTRKMISQGDPGNVSTVKLLLACTRVFFGEEFAPRGGFFTPASGFGDRLLPALNESGVRWI